MNAIHTYFPCMWGDAEMLHVTFTCRYTSITLFTQAPGRQAQA